jgi:hypothetical protein
MASKVKKARPAPVTMKVLRSFVDEVSVVKYRSDGFWSAEAFEGNRLVAQATDKSRYVAMRALFGALYEREESRG